jgi:uncharacterized integral membrane protein
MHIFYWLVKIFLFMALFVFAAINTDPVVVRYFPGREWQMPLAFVLFVVFGGGALIGIVSGITVVARQRREILALRQTLRRMRMDAAT